MSLLSRAEEYLKQAEDQANLLSLGRPAGGTGEETGDDSLEIQRTRRSLGAGSSLLQQTPTRGGGGFNSRLPRVSVSDIPSRYLFFFLPHVLLPLSLLTLWKYLDVHLLAIQISQRFMKLLIMI